MVPSVTRSCVSAGAGRVLFAGAVACLAACATPQQSGYGCAAGFHPVVSAYLYFGANTPDGSVSDAQWQVFLDDVVTPRFPDGFSVWSANGQWRSAGGTIEREAARVLNVVHSGGTDESRALAEIAGAYRDRYQQESVLDVETPGCARF